MASNLFDEVYFQLEEPVGDEEISLRRIKRGTDVRSVDFSG
jgi:hypothetical protein